MVTKSKIEEVRKKIRKTIKNEKMVIENEPDFTGHPNNTIVNDEAKQDCENEKEIQNENDAKKNWKNTLKICRLKKSIYYCATKT